MTPEKQKSEHNYRRSLLRLIESGRLQAAIPRGAMGVLQVQHDGDCSIWSGSYCDCEPIFSLELPRLEVGRGVQE